MKTKMIMRMAALTAACFAGAATAETGDLFVGGHNNVVFRGGPDGQGMQFLGVCGGQIESMALLNGEIWAGDLSGSIYRIDADAGFVVGTMNIGVTPLAMVASNEYIYIAGDDGSVLELDPATGAFEAILDFPTPMHALAISGRTLYAGGHSTLFYRADLDLRTFQMIGACGGQIDSMTLHRNTLLLGTLHGNVYRYEGIDGSYLTDFNMPSAQRAMVMDGTVLIVAGADGVIRRVSPVTGEVFATFDAPTDVQAMVIDLPPVCLADFNADGGLTISDFVVFRATYNDGDINADMNGDGVLSITDFTAFRMAYGNGCP